MTNLISLRLARVLQGLAATAFVLLLPSGAAFAQPVSDGTAAQDAGAHAKPSIKLVGVIMDLPPGSPWLSMGTGSLCNNGPADNWSGGRMPQNLPAFTAAFKAQLAAAGYTVVTPNDNLFAPDDSAADYQAAAVITQTHIVACSGGLLSGHGMNDLWGDATMSVDWQIYSPVKKTLVARVRTNTSQKIDNSTRESMRGGAETLVAGIFGANARELTLNNDFRTAMNAPSPLANGFVLPGQQSKIVLTGNRKAGPRTIADAVGSVVTLITSDGSGSGVLVSSDGYFLTNAHVVGDETTLRVRWSDGIETVGQVIRVAKDRDVALVKTDARDRVPLTIKRGALNPGQKVYAIGSPKGEKFQGTVTSGVVSTTRIMDGLRYIQSDVMVSFGSSGGALVDETGSLIGLTDLGVPNAGQPAGLNLFIPITDALDFLSLEQQ